MSKSKTIRIKRFNAADVWKSWSRQWLWGAFVIREDGLARKRPFAASSSLSQLCFTLKDRAAHE